MYVIEVQPKEAWRGLRLSGRYAAQRAIARVTTRHTAASHWFQRTTADRMVKAGLIVRVREKKQTREVDLSPDRWRVEECACSPLTLRGVVRVKGPKKTGLPGRRPKRR